MASRSTAYPVVVLDNGSKLLRSPLGVQLAQRSDLAILSFDPDSTLEAPSRFAESPAIHYFAGAMVGDGEPTTRDRFADPAMSGAPRRKSHIKALGKM